MPALTKAMAAVFWSAVISSSGKPLRVYLRVSLSCNGMKFQSKRSSLSNAKIACFFWSGVRLPTKPSAAATMLAPLVSTCWAT